MKQGLLFIFLLITVHTISAQLDSTLLAQQQFKSLFRSDPITEPSVAFGPQGKTLYFSRKGVIFNHGKANNSDIWMAQLDKEIPLQWKDPINLGPQVNSEVDEQVLSINEQENHLYFTQIIDQQLRLFLIEKQGRRWGKAVLVPIPDLPSFTNIKSYMVSADEQTLFICGTKDSIRTNADIYFSRKGLFGQWSYPTLLSLPIDLHGDECSVYLAADNKSLFFASNGLQGFGGYDLYYTKMKGDDNWNQWSVPQNMGPSINTRANEFGLSMSLSGKQLAFISDIRKNKKKVFLIQTPYLFLPDQIEVSNGNEEETEVIIKGINHF